MVGIVQTHRHHDVSGTDVCPTTERLLQPELFQLHLAAFLGLLFPLAAFLVFLLVGYAVAAVLELNLGAQRPALAEVVAQVDDGVWYVEAAVRGVVPVCFGLAVAAYVVAIEVA